MVVVVAELAVGELYRCGLLDGDGEGEMGTMKAR